MFLLRMRIPLTVRSRSTLLASKFTTRALSANFVGFFYWGNSVVDRKVSFKKQLCL